jgi:hypothetical protein
MPLQMRERVLAVARLVAGETVVPHQMHEHLAQTWLIIDDEAVW